MRKGKKNDAKQSTDMHERPVDIAFTEASPGSAEKIELMRMRLERGVSLFHEYDRGIAENFYQSEDHVQLRKCLIEKTNGRNLTFESYQSECVAWL